MKVKTMADLARLVGKKRIVERYKQSSRAIYEKFEVQYGQADISLDLKTLTYDWDVPEWVSGHADIAHGGMISFIYDSMMGILATARAFAKGRVAFTKELRIFYHAPLQTKGMAKVNSFVKEVHGSQLVITSEIIDCSGKKTSSAEGTFVLKEVKKLK